MMNTIGVNGRQSLMEFRQGDSNTATYSSLSISLTQSDKVVHKSVVCHLFFNLKIAQEGI